MRFLLTCILCLSSLLIVAQPHPYGCQHWRQSAGKGQALSSSASRSLNESILRSDTFDILHYDIAIDLTAYGSQQISAQTEITFLPKMANLDFIRFDLVRLIVDSVKNESGLLPFTTDSQFVKVQYPSALTLNDTNSLTIYYHGHPYQDPVWGGFYFESGYIYNLGIGLSTIPPNFGKVWYPCFDSFVERATYSYHVKTSGSYKAHCQGSFLGEQQLGGDTVIRSYEFNQPLPTHLSAIAASNYFDLNFTHNGNYAPVPVKLTAKPADTSAMRAKFSSIGSAIDACEYWYGPTGWPGVGYALTTDGALEVTGNIAYPVSMLTQTSAINRNLYSHELGHYWWGNWIAPYNHNDMWLKEGPAEYSSHLTAGQDEGPDAFIKEVKDNHEYVLKTAHISDGGYYALSPMPDEVIYGDHTYYKGASVMHNLRGYMGDELFRQAMSAVQANHPYETITPDQFRQYLEEESGTSLEDFFNDQVYKPGFSVFVVDSFTTSPQAGNFNVDVFIQQKLHKCPTFYGVVPLDLTIVGANRQRIDFQIIANGQFSHSNITVPFEPVMVILNGYNRLNQARTDFESTYVDGQTISNGILPYSEFRLYLDTLPDSTLFRVDHIWSAPDSSLRTSDVYQFSNSHYWHVDGVWPENAEMHAQLSYTGNTIESLDYSLFHNSEAEAVLIYRENASKPWHVYEDYTIVTGSLTNGLGTIKIDKLRKGDYAFANGNILAGIDVNNPMTNPVIVYPNPVSDQLTIKIQDSENDNLIFSIYNQAGGLVKRESRATNLTCEFKFDVSNFESGLYYFVVKNNSGKHTYFRNFIVTH